MRLSEQQLQAIKESVSKELTQAEIFLYGSRVDDDKRGGDIDLLVYSEAPVNLMLKTKIKSKIKQKIGDQKLDIQFLKSGETNAFVELVKSEAIKLQ